MAKLTLEIEKMSCGGCVRSVMKTLNALDGTRATEVHIGGAEAETNLPSQQVIDALTTAGYPTRVVAGA
ncbi:heavy-metal-associated domain-containing protein [Granulicella cerasi]|uniref:Heavy-metal-associated domain-containing protein n=1 Tax=Granulicella cerasi TaxID=741063 RepID=A0ABW1ZE17_9BACT|nr:heavy-metal-associated domain-containing protein [Granulicella cerasi]